MKFLRQSMYLQWNSKQILLLPFLYQLKEILLSIISTLIEKFPVFQCLCNRMMYLLFAEYNVGVRNKSNKCTRQSEVNLCRCTDTSCFVKSSEFLFSISLTVISGMIFNYQINSVRVMYLLRPRPTLTMSENSNCVCTTQYVNRSCFRCFLFSMNWFFPLVFFQLYRLLGFAYIPLNQVFLNL